MYELGGPLEETDVEAGSNLLVSGAPMTGKRELALEMLAHGAAQGSIIVTTKDNAETILDSYREHGGGNGQVGVVDCVTRQQGMGSEDESNYVRYASSPVDLTGIGIEISELLEQFYDDGMARNRILLHSLSTLLMYSNLQTVFRFLHVFTGRIQSADGLGVFVIDSTAHDEQTMSTLKQLFDGVVNVRESESGREFRTSGVSGGQSEWTQF